MRFHAITNHKLAMPVGLLFLAVALIIEKFLPSNNGLDFIAGFLFGISIVFNLSYIVKLRKAKS
jgi:hypothetical protein